MSLKILPAMGRMPHSGLLFAEISEKLAGCFEYRRDVPGRGKLKRQDVELHADEEPIHVPINDAAIAALSVVHVRRGD